MLKPVLVKAKQLLHRARPWNLSPDRRYTRVHYTGVPVWKPWRDF
jgi:hypothetical protein